MGDRGEDLLYLDVLVVIVEPFDVHSQAMLQVLGFETDRVGIERLGIDRLVNRSTGLRLRGLNAVRVYKWQRREATPVKWTGSNPALSLK